MDKKLIGENIVNSTFNLTKACNLACQYCFTYGCTRGRMPFEIAKKGIDFLFNNAKIPGDHPDEIGIQFWGGEPFLEWDLMQRMMKYAVAIPRGKLRLSFGGTTNGTLLTPEKFGVLDEYKAYFMVSYDGTQETHDYYRKFKDGRGSHKIITKNLEAVLKKWPFYRVRQSLLAERVDHFYEDFKWIMDMGVGHIMFSPVYEGPWTTEKWQIWKDQAKAVVDEIISRRKRGVKIEVEHFKSYAGPDNSKWPCGAGRFYVGIDIDGAIYPCHRFNKFTDTRPWQEKEVCLGHVDYGIIRPEWRQQFIEWHPQCEKTDCQRLKDTPCHGGCYAVNWDFHHDLTKAHPGMCEYVEAQREVSLYLVEELKKIGEPSMEPQRKGRPCVCYNMCYNQGTSEEIRDLDPTSDIACVCYNSSYSGDMNPPNTAPMFIKHEPVPDTKIDKADTAIALTEMVLKRLITLEKLLQAKTPVTVAEEKDGECPDPNSRKE